MKIVTWNIRHGGGKRVREIINGIKKYSDSEIFILTEFRNNINGGQIKNALSNLGYQEIQTTNSEKKTNSQNPLLKLIYLMSSENTSTE